MTKRLCAILWLLCMIGAWAVLPYIVFLTGMNPSSVSYLSLFLISTLQAGVLYGVVCWLSYLILKKVDLHPFHISNFSKQIIYPGILAGLLVGLVIFGLDKTIFQSSLLVNMHPPFWAGALASIYGGINEEVLMRLFLLTLFYFCFQKIFKPRHERQPFFMWMAIFIVALIFGAGHLFAAVKVAPLSIFEVTRILLLNGIGGVTLGWLYYTNGFWAAALAHFVADLVIHVFLI